MKNQLIDCKGRAKRFLRIKSGFWVLPEEKNVQQFPQTEKNISNR